MKLLIAPKPTLQLMPGRQPDEIRGAGDYFDLGGGANVPPEFELQFRSPGSGGRGKGDVIFFTDSHRPRLYKLATLTHFDGMIWTAGTHAEWFPSDPCTSSMMRVHIQSFFSPTMPTPGQGHLHDPKAHNLIDGSIKVDGGTRAGTWRVHFFENLPQPDDGRREPFTPPSEPIPASSRMISLAKQLRTVHDNPWDLTIAIIDHIQQNCKYDQNHPHSRTNPIEDFLFESHRGICQHFAGAACALLNLAGQKARVVVGYASSQTEPSKVTSNGAHAWIEVFFHSIGWVEFDPTQNADRLEEDPEDRDKEGQEQDPGVTDEELGQLEQDLEASKEPDPVGPGRPFFERLADIDSWARALGSDITRRLVDRTRPRRRGAYETGVGVNTSQLYRLTVGDNRVAVRRHRVIDEPVELLFAYDESGSINQLSGVRAVIWKRARWMLVEGLGYARQDFAIGGFNSTHAWYKRLGEPYTDRVRDKLVTLANQRMGGGTNASRAIKEMRMEHRRLPKSRRHLIILTDGKPSNPDGVREEVQLAHSEGLHTTCVWMYNPSHPAKLADVEKMFDRILILDGTEQQKADDQLRSMLTKIVTS